jgi:hypothetical protein
MIAIAANGKRIRNQVFNIFHVSEPIRARVDVSIVNRIIFHKDCAGQIHPLPLICPRWNEPAIKKRLL